MLLVLEPFTIVLLTIRKRVHTIPLTLAFEIRAFINISILVHGLTFSMRFARYNFTLICTSVFRLTRPQSNLLGVKSQRGNQHYYQNEKYIVLHD